MQQHWTYHHGHQSKEKVCFHSLSFLLKRAHKNWRGPEKLSTEKIREKFAQLTVEEEHQYITIALNIINCAETLKDDIVNLIIYCNGNIGWR